MSRRPRALSFAAAGVSIVLAACTGAAPPSPTPGGPTGEPAASPAATTAIEGRVTIYSGRSRELVEPLIERFRQATGLEVEVNYGATSELASTILEEGDRSPADVFFAQDAGALGAIAGEGRLTALPAELLDLVDARFRSRDGLWVGVSGRARVAAYNTAAVTENELPASILDFTDPKWKGRLGWAPSNGSFQAFVTALRVVRGDDAAKAWLEGIQANEPRVYEGNLPALEAVAARDIHVAFVNHYYLLGQLAEQGDAYPVRNHFFAGGDPGALVNVAGAGILTTSKNPAAARAFVEFLLAEESQRYFAEETFEYPLLAGVPADDRLVPLEQLESPDIDLSDLADLEGTLTLLQQAGVL